MKPVETVPAADAVIPRHVAESIIEAYVEEREQLFALATSLEQQLASRCNHGKHAPDGAPLVQWRLAELLTGIVETTKTERLMRAYVDGAGVAHG